jgi:hypothetical protein
MKLSHAMKFKLKLKELISFQNHKLAALSSQLRAKVSDVVKYLRFIIIRFFVKHATVSLSLIFLGGRRRNLSALLVFVSEQS